MQQDFSDYSKVLVQINSSKDTQDYIYFTIHGTVTATPVQGYLIVYGVKDWSGSVDSGVYDNINDQMFEYKNGDMQMKTDLDMDNKRIRNLNAVDNVFEYNNNHLNFNAFINMQNKTICNLGIPRNNSDTVSPGYRCS